MNGLPILALSLTLALSVAEGLAGCVQVGPKALFPERGGAAPTMAAPSVGAAAPRNTCALPDLPPLAATLFVDIAPGQPVKADAGGRALVLGYGQARDAIRACREDR